MHFNLFLSADPSIGRIDKHSLSQHTLLELFLENTENKEQIYRSNKFPEDIFGWKDLELSIFSEITEIHWNNKQLKGNISLQWLPLSVKSVYIYTNELTGTVDLTCLPDSLERLNLAKNAFHGSVDLTHLPEKMTMLYMYRNNFCGVTDFSTLPKSLEHLNIEDTQLEGEVFRFDGWLAIGNSKVKDMRKK